MDAHFYHGLKVETRLVKSTMALILLTASLNGCAPKTAFTAKSSKSGMTASSGVIGGEAVEHSSFFAQKVLYLALGVEKTTDSAGNHKVKWGGLCTASAISTHLILTAAHCVKGRSAEQLSIVLTGNPGSTPLDLTQWHSIQELQVHPKYIGKADGFRHDLALLLLKESLAPEQVLEIDDGSQIHSPQDLISVGFGTTSDLSDSAQAAQNMSGLHFVLRSVKDFSQDSGIFSVEQSDHKGFCNGDSGGPGLVYNSVTNKLNILGVVSNTSMLDSERNNLDPKHEFSLCIGHGNYTNVTQSELRDWIEQTKQELQAIL